MEPYVDVAPADVERDLDAAAARAALTCSDVPPAGSAHSCGQQHHWMKCGESWMADHCCLSCFECQGPVCGANTTKPPAAPGSVDDDLAIGPKEVLGVLGFSALFFAYVYYETR